MTYSGTFRSFHLVSAFRGCDLYTGVTYTPRDTVYRVSMKSTRNRRPRALAVAFRAQRGRYSKAPRPSITRRILTNLERHTKNLHGNQVKLALTCRPKRLRP